MRKILIIPALLFIMVCQGQPVLTAGDALPGIVFKETVHTDEGQLQFSDYKGRFIILDFWATSCAGCIRGFPKLEAMQQLYGEKLQIILVSRERRDAVLAFFAKHPKIKMPELPMITGDSVLEKMFPHPGLPYQIWADTEGIVAATGEMAHAVNVREWLDGSRTDWKQVNTERLVVHLREELPLFYYADSSMLNDASYWSYLMPAVDEWRGTDRVSAERGSAAVNRIVCNRIQAKQLFFEAWNERLGNIKDIQQVVVEATDSTRFYDPLFAYDLLVPVKDAPALYAYMREDMRRYFNADAFITEREAPCYVLRLQKDMCLTASTTAKPFTGKRTAAGREVLVLQNQPVRTLMNLLRMKLGRKVPVVDATGFSGRTDLVFDASVFDKLLPTDLAAIEKALLANGLELVKMPWAVKTLVICDRGE